MARGLTWTIVEVWGRQGLTFLVFVVLANLLVPADFGLVALAAVFVNLAQVVVDQGLGDALIQRRTLTRSQVDTAFWVAMLTGAGLTALALLLAGPISVLLGEPDLAPILQALSATFLLSAMSSIQIALLRRELAFRSLAVRALLAAMVGGLVGIIMAILGFGAWALVGQQIASAAASVLALWTLLAWRPGLRFSTGEFRGLFSFGSRVVASDILTFLSRNMDNLLIGAFLGTVPLGLYAVGYRILDTSQALVIEIARKIAFPALATLQQDPTRMRSGYFRVSRAGAALIMPAYIGLALIAPELVTVLFGERWAESGPVASILSLIGPALSVQAFSASLLYASNHPGVVFRIRLLTTVTNVIGFTLAVPFGILAVAAAFTVRGYLLLPVVLVWMRRYAGVPAWLYLSQFRGIAAATGSMAVAVIAFKFGLGDGIGRAPLLAVEVGAGAVVFGVALWLADRPLMRELVDVGRHAIAGHARNRQTAEVPGADADPRES